MQTYDTNLTEQREEHFNYLLSTSTFPLRETFRNNPELRQILREEFYQTPLELSLFMYTQAHTTPEERRDGEREPGDPGLGNFKPAYETKLNRLTDEFNTMVGAQQRSHFPSQLIPLTPDQYLSHNIEATPLIKLLRKVNKRIKDLVERASTETGTLAELELIKANAKDIIDDIETYVHAKQWPRTAISELLHALIEPVKAHEDIVNWAIISNDSKKKVKTIASTVFERLCDYHRNHIKDRPTSSTKRSKQRNGSSVQQLNKARLTDNDAPSQKTELIGWFEHTSKYATILGLLVEREFIQSGTCVWINPGIGLIPELIKYLYSMGFFGKGIKPTNEEIGLIASNTFGVKVSASTIAHAKTPTGHSHIFSFIGPASTYC